MSDMFVICMYVCTKSFLKPQKFLVFCTHLANKADSDSDSDSDKILFKNILKILLTPNIKMCTMCLIVYLFSFTFYISAVSLIAVSIWTTYTI